MKIIGLSGTNGSGKDTVAAMLAERYGFYVVSATDMLSEELIKRGLPTDRTHKRQLSAEWRKQSGLGAVVDRAVEQAKNAGKDKLVVGSLRNPGEADSIHALNGIVLWVDADPKVRYGRITSTDRGRIEDKKTYEEFLADQEAEMYPSGDETTLNIAGVKAKSDVFLENDGESIEEFKNQADQILQKYLK